MKYIGITSSPAEQQEVKNKYMSVMQELEDLMQNPQFVKSDQRIQALYEYIKRAS
jgi:hypothetical protein